MVESLIAGMRGWPLGGMSRSLFKIFRWVSGGWGVRPAGGRPAVPVHGCWHRSAAGQWPAGRPEVSLASGSRPGGSAGCTVRLCGPLSDSDLRLAERARSRCLFAGINVVSSDSSDSSGARKGHPRRARRDVFPFSASRWPGRRSSSCLGAPAVAARWSPGRGRCRSGSPGRGAGRPAALRAVADLPTGPIPARRTVGDHPRLVAGPAGVAGVGGRRAAPATLGVAGSLRPTVIVQSD